MKSCWRAGDPVYVKPLGCPGIIIGALDPKIFKPEEDYHSEVTWLVIATPQGIWRGVDTEQTNPGDYLHYKPNVRWFSEVKRRVHMQTKKYWLYFKGESAKDTIICKLARLIPLPFEFDIRQATVTPEMSIMAIEFRGPHKEQFDQAVSVLESFGVRVEPIEGDVFA